MKRCRKSKSVVKICMICAKTLTFYHGKNIDFQKITKTKHRATNLHHRALLVKIC